MVDVIEIFSEGFAQRIQRRSDTAKMPSAFIATIEEPFR